MESLSYQQTTGKLLNPDSSLLAQCYSGLGKCKNDPDSQGIKDWGPIPQGGYTMVSYNEVFEDGRHGPGVIVLVPDKSNEMFARGGFLIHGDNSTHTASEGCIVVSPESVRKSIWASKTKHIIVVRGPSGTASSPPA